MSELKNTMSDERKAYYQERFDTLVRDYVNEHGYSGKDHKIIMGNLWIDTTSGSNLTKLCLSYRGAKHE